jgi:hypothetical protein
MGHGHHRATSILYREAIRRLIAAADPAAPLLYMERDNRQRDSIRLDANQALPHGNWSAMQWAHVALRRHRSQGMALRPPSPDAGRKDYRPVIHQLDPKALDVWKLSADAWAPEQLASLLGVAIEEDRDAAALRLQAQRLRAKTAPLFRAGPWLAVQNGWERSLQSTLPAGRFQLLDAPSPWRVQQLGDGTKIRILARSHSASAAYPSHDTLREHRTLADSLSFALSIDADTRIEFRLALPRLAPNTLELASDLPIAIAGQASSVRLRWWGGAEPIGLSAMSTQSVSWEQEPWRESGPGSFERNLVVQVDANASDPVRFQIVGKDVSESFELRLQSIADTRQTRIGFISGADGSSAEALRAIGMTVSDLDAATLERGDLSIFDVILVDIRAYLENEALRENNARLLSWVRAGGHLVVQYQKVFEWNPDRGNPVFAPLELLLGHGRVVDESAAPKFLQPKHPFFHYPHPLDADSFDGWVQERGLYFPEQWGPRFADLLAFADPTEEEQSGCLLTAAIGEGHYTYSSLVWYRQLRAGIPGAYQAFVNLLLWPQAPHSLEP